MIKKKIGNTQDYFLFKNITNKWAKFFCLSIQYKITHSIALLHDKNTPLCTFFAGNEYFKYHISVHGTGNKSESYL